jgi:predicted Zn finger-like uncharacterized protein
MNCRLASDATPPTLARDTKRDDTALLLRIVWARRHPDFDGRGRSSFDVQETGGDTMIIQCNRCAAKFRFDDALVGDRGVWVRCSLCQLEFFRPPAGAPSDAPSLSPEVGSNDFAAAQSGGAAEPVGLHEPPDKDFDSESLLRDDLSAEPQDDADDVQDTETPKKSRKKALGIRLALLLLLIVLAGVFFLSFPEAGKEALRLGSAYLPGLEQKKHPPLEETLRIEALKQRYMTNLFAGPVRVVEGETFNASGRPVARLQLKIAMTDAQDKLLAEKSAFAGNVLTDEELLTLTEEEMNARMANPEGGAAANLRIIPGGRIPFMVVMIKEPPGVEKVFVTVSGGEALSQ